MKIVRKFRNKKFYIYIKNNELAQKGVRSITINDLSIDGNFIPLSKMQNENDVIVVLGK